MALYVWLTSLKPPSCLYFVCLRSCDSLSRGSRVEQWKWAANIKYTLPSWGYSLWLWLVLYSTGSRRAKWTHSTFTDLHHLLWQDFMIHPQEVKACISGENPCPINQDVINSETGKGDWVVEATPKFIFFLNLTQFSPLVLLYKAVQRAEQFAACKREYFARLALSFWFIWSSVVSVLLCHPEPVLLPHHALLPVLLI